MDEASPEPLPAVDEPDPPFPPVEALEALYVRHNEEFAVWRTLHAEKWVHCTRCDGFHKIAFVPRIGLCSSMRLEPVVLPVQAPLVPAPANCVDLTPSFDDDDDDGPPAKKVAGPKRDAKMDAAVWQQIRMHRISSGH